MTELFKTVLLLSGFGFLVTALLLCLKPITAKRFPARWQYCAWVLVLLLMIFPVYKLIPESEARKVPLMVPVNTPTVQDPVTVPTETPTTVAPVPTTPLGEIIPLEQDASLWDIVATVWLVGFVLFLSAIVISYLLFVLKKRKGAVTLSESESLNEIKSILRIRRKVRVKMSPAVRSPLLVGVFRPMVYLPCRELSDERLRMVFLHELTHYKRKDLLVKWLSVFVNAVHWFNPLAYLLTANVSESCEVSCDMAVTRSMSEEEQRLYMKTILDLLEQKEAS